MPRSRPPSRRHVVLLLLAVCCGIASCFVWPQKQRGEPSFPHRVHVVENKLECSFCHGTARSSDSPGMPPPELCAPCHSRFDGEKPEARRVGAFFTTASRYRTVAESGLATDVRFSHRAHVADARLDCTECHADIAEQTSVPLEPLAKKPVCMDCHARAGKQNACAECHTTIGRDWQPPTHDAMWTRRHGGCAAAPSGASQDRCDLCHDAGKDCRACHERTAPQDHDQTFRRRTHGLMVSIDRSRCATCHTQDGCAQCHETTPPQSHRAGFAFPQQTHCVGCHLPLADNGCAVCHRSTPSHDQATAMPAGHNPAMNCRLCHGNGVQLPHPDGGHVCTACHH